jgi:hypothetical protein
MIKKSRTKKKLKKQLKQRRSKKYGGSNDLNMDISKAFNYYGIMSLLEWNENRLYSKKNSPNHIQCLHLNNCITCNQNAKCECYIGMNTKHKCTGKNDISIFSVGNTIKQTGLDGTQSELKIMFIGDFIISKDSTYEERIIILKNENLNIIFVLFKYGQVLTNEDLEDDNVKESLKKITDTINDNINLTSNLHLYGHSMGCIVIMNIYKNIKSNNINIRFTGFIGDITPEPPIVKSMYVLNLGFLYQNSLYIDNYTETLTKFNTYIGVLTVTPNMDQQGAITPVTKLELRKLNHTHNTNIKLFKNTSSDLHQLGSHLAFIADKLLPKFKLKYPIVKQEEEEEYDN